MLFSGALPFWTPAVEPFTIAHLSDVDCSGGYFVPDLMERAIAEINDLNPDIVVCSGDPTTMGFKEEYARAKRYPIGSRASRLLSYPETMTRETSATSTSRTMFRGQELGTSQRAG